jgi:hypothetical protein
MENKKPDLNAFSLFGESYEEMRKNFSENRFLVNPKIMRGIIRDVISCGVEAPLLAFKVIDAVAEDARHALKTRATSIQTAKLLKEVAESGKYSCMHAIWAQQTLDVLSRPEKMKANRVVKSKLAAGD